MRINPEIHKPSEKHFAWHPQPNNPHPLQWWYHEAVFDNGYAMTIVYSLTEVRGYITFDICDPDGNRTTEMPIFPPDQLAYSTETLDVKAGENFIRGKSSRYELHFRSGDNGADLVYEATTQGWMEPRDGVYIGRATFPATTPHFAYYNYCRCAVSGKLIVAGKEIPVKGDGYRDHQWGNVLMWDMLQYWYWGKLNFPKHTVMWWESMLQSKYGYQKFKWLWGFKGDNLIEYKNDAKMYIEPCDFKEHPQYGVSLPQKFIITIDDERIKGTVTHSVKSILYFIQLPEEMHATGWTKYIRYVSDCKGEFEVDGEKIKINSVQIHESGV